MSPVTRTVSVAVPAKGPGKGQRGAWQTHVPTELREGDVWFDKIPGLTGGGFAIALADLAQLVDHYEQETAS